MSSTTTTSSTTTSTSATTTSITSTSASCSIQVGINGSYTFMQDCSTGKILFHSANAAAVINDAIGNLTSGGKIFIKAGTYTLTTSTISPSSAIGTTSVSNIELYGEGNSTILFAGRNLNAAVIGVYNANGWYIHDLQVNGNRASQSDSGGNPPFLYGISVYDSDDSVIEHCYVHDTKTFGINVYGVGDSIIDNWVANNNANGIQANGGPGSSGSNYLIQGNIVNGASDAGISINGASTTTSINNVLCIGNTVENINLGLSPWSINSGTGIEAGDNGPALNVTISGNQVDGGVAHGIESGPPPGSTNVGILISGNSVYSSTIAAIDGALTNGFTISDNTISLSVGFGIETYTSPSVQISGNTITSSRISSGSSYLITNYAANAQINGNTLRGGYLSIYTDGAATQISSNTATDAYVGMSLDSGAINSQVNDNFAYVNPGLSSEAIYLDGSTSAISDNHIVGYVGLLIDSGASNANVEGNDLRNCTYPISGSGSGYTAPTATGVILLSNVGYNPRGTIKSPFVSRGDYVLDTGGAATPVNCTAMTVWDSPKNITVVIGSTWTSPTGGNAHTLVIMINGAIIISTNAPTADTVYTFNLNPGQTFYIQYQSKNNPVTFIVSGD